MSRSYDPRMHAYDDRTRHAGMLYILMIVIAVAFGGFVWQLYSAPDVPRISAEPGPYKIQPPPEAASAPDAIEQSAFETATNESTGTAPTVSETTVVENETPTTAGPPQLSAAPQFVASGPFLAQLAALQSEAAVDQAWRRLSSRAPQLFAHARLDVQRADLGQRGVYYRIRAGYFADRANASRFCERVRQMGQDCIVAAR
jgi:hypothetical protein